MFSENYCQAIGSINLPHAYCGNIISKYKNSVESGGKFSETGEFLTSDAVMYDENNEFRREKMSKEEFFRWFLQNGAKIGISFACIAVFCTVMFLSIGFLDKKKLSGGNVDSYSNRRSEIPSEKSHKISSASSAQSGSASSSNMEFDDDYESRDFFDSMNGIYQHGEWIYYHIVDKISQIISVIKSKTDGTSRQVLYEGNLYFSRVVGEWLQLSDSDETFYRMKTDGTGLEKVYSKQPDDEFVYIINDKLIYKKDGYFYISDFDKVNSKKLIDEKLHSFTIKDNLVYYYSTIKGGHYKTSMEGYGTAESVEWINLPAYSKGGYDYFYGKKGSVLRTDKLGNEKIIAEGLVSGYSFGGDWLYYIDGNDVYRLNLDGSGEKVKILNTDRPIVNLYGLRNRLCYAFDDSVTADRYSMNFDGTDQRLLN